MIHDWIKMQIIRNVWNYEFIWIFSRFKNKTIIIGCVITISMICLSVYLNFVI